MPKILDPSENNNKILQMTPEVIRRLSIIRGLMIRHNTQSADTIHSLLDTLPADQSIDLSVSSVRTYINTVKDQYHTYFAQLASGGYSVMAQDEHEKLNRLINHFNKRIVDSKSDTAAAHMTNALLSLYERRQYVIEDMVIYPAVNNWADRLKVKNETILTDPE